MVLDKMSVGAPGFHHHKLLSDAWYLERAVGRYRFCYRAFVSENQFGVICNIEIDVETCYLKSLTCMLYCLCGSARHKALRHVYLDEPKVCSSGGHE